ncbi:MAG: sugar ABC transporter ATP-binding protein [Sphaerochaetaceae bacterium]
MPKLLKMEGIDKSFGSTHALKVVDFEVDRNEIVGLVGENGAGKSTLMKILAGVYKADLGRIFLEGKEISINNLVEASTYGIGMIFQEQSVLKNIPVYENLFISHENMFTTYGVISKKKMINTAKRVLQEIGLDISPTTNTFNLNYSQRQLVEIARNIWLSEVSEIENPLIILDEPTTVLEQAEIDFIFAKLKQLKERLSIVYISHNLSEVVALCDRTYILRDGEVVSCLGKSDTSVENIRDRMVGQGSFNDNEYYLTDLQRIPEQEVVLEVENLHKYMEFEDISFKLYKGEILSLCGTVGSGKEALCESLCGLRQSDGGKILINGKRAVIKNPYDAYKYGIGYTPEDRRNAGLIQDLPIYENMTLPILTNLRKALLFIDRVTQKELCTNAVKTLNIRLQSLQAACSSLSGGNQQKVIIAKWVLSKVRILIMSHPTRGVDVKAKQQIYEVMRDLVNKGISIILMGDSFEEDIGMANRIITMKNRRITGELEATQSKPAFSDVLEKIV